MKKATLIILVILSFVLTLGAVKVAAQGTIEPNRPEGNYAYAPFALSNDVVYYCGNPGYSRVDDVIVRANPDGSEQIVMRPQKWASKHVCDPDMVHGEFWYNGVKHSKLMVFTGTADPYLNGTCNDVGIAVGDGFNWTMVSTPLINDNCSGRDDWGVGQPSVTSIDGKGQVMVFYYRHAVGLRALHVDLSNVNYPKKYKDWHTGIADIQTDVAYHPSSKQFIVLTAGQFTSSHPNYISSTERLWKIADADMWSGNAQRRTLIREFNLADKTHNGGIVTNWYGMVDCGGDCVETRHTVSRSLPGWDALWDYHITGEYRTSIGGGTTVATAPPPTTTTVPKSEPACTP